MDLLKICLSISIGLVIIIFSGNFLVNNAIILSRITKIPEVMIGATVVSLATTLPELSVTIFSSIENADSLAMGNAIGSMVFNLTFIIGLCIAFLPQEIDAKNSKKNFIFLFVCLSLLFVIGSFNCMNIFYGIVLLIMCGYYLFSNFLDAKKRVSVDSVRLLYSRVSTEKLNFSKKDAFKALIKLIIGSALVLVGAKVLISGCLKLAGEIGISHHIVGVTLVAIGTSLPELVTAISAIRKKATSIAVGNIIGANVLSCTLLVGATSVMNGGYLSFDKNITFFALPICAFSLLLLYLPIRKHNVTKRYQGILLLILGVIYYATVFKGL